MIKSLINSYVKIGIVLVLMFSVLHSFGQSSQPFEILLYHGQDAKTPFEGVSVSAVDASTVMSDAQGQLTLTFRTRKFGDQIQFRRIDRSGYEVMNTEAIEAARISRPSADDPDASKLRIVMAPQQLLRQLRDGYRSVAVQRYEKQLKASEAEIQRLREAGKLAEEEYNERMNQLEEDYEAQLSKLETYIEKFARIDLSDLDADERQIIALVQQGEFEEALALYDKQDLANRLRQSRADQQKLAEASQQIAAAERQKALENQRLRQSIDRQVILLRMAGGEENLQKAYQIIHETFLADTTDCDSRRVYATSLREQARDDEALAVLQAGISASTDPFNLGMLLLDMMDLQWDKNTFDESYSLAQRAEEILFPLRDSEYKVLTRGLPAIYSIYLNYKMTQDDFESCTTILRSIDQFWSPDTLSRNSLNTYIDLLGNMNAYYSHVNNSKKTLWCTNQLILLGEQFNKLYPWANLLYDTYAEACSTYAFAGMIAEAKNAADRSMQLIEENLNHGISKSRYKVLCYDLYTIVDALNAIGQYQQGDSIIVLADKYQIFEKTDLFFPHVNDDYYGCYLMTCVSTKLNMGNLPDAERRYETGIERLAQVEDEGYLLHQMQPGTQAQIRQAQEQYEEAERLYHEAIDFFASQYKDSNDAWDADSQCRYLLLLAEMQWHQGKRKDCQRTLKQAERSAAFAYSQQRIKEMKKQFK